MAGVALVEDRIAIYLIDSSGVSLSGIQAIGRSETARIRGGGQSQFTPDGSKFVRFNAREGLQVFDFDRTTGTLSNFNFTPFPEFEWPDVAIGGLGISSSSQFAYVSNSRRVFQYDLWAEDIDRSRQLIHEMTNPDSLHPLLHPTAVNFQLGPDCKLYSYNISGDKYNVIHRPDERGAACDFEQGGLDLGVWVFRDQPYFPNFRLGPLGDEGSPCADIISSNEPPRPAPVAGLSVFPNPAGAETNLFLPAGAGPGDFRWRLFDAAGRLLRAVELRAATTTRVGLDTPAGLYFWTLDGPNDTRQRGRLVVR